MHTQAPSHGQEETSPGKQDSVQCLNITSRKGEAAVCKYVGVFGLVLEARRDAEGQGRA